MNELFTGSICLTDLVEKANAKHSAFSKGKNGKIYCNIAIWKNAEKDKYGNVIGIQLQSTKDMREVEGKFYIGNAKPSEAPPAQPVAGNEPELQFKGDGIEERKVANNNNEPEKIAEDSQDLPF